MLGDLHAHDTAAPDAAAHNAIESSAPPLRTTFSREEVLEIARKLSELGEAIDVMPEGSAQREEREEGEVDAEGGESAVELSPEAAVEGGEPPAAGKD